MHELSRQIKMIASSDPEPAMRFFFLIFAALALPAAADMSGGDVYDPISGS
ncbi:MAG: hypothetical protein Q8N17_12205 [Burkholderiaceae bacterium]|nr:hypothetical protein [Burkholderiaceae bacterium]